MYVNTSRGVVAIGLQWLHCIYLDYTASILLLFRREGPKKLSPTGIGIIIAATHARSVPAHYTPRFANICREKRGNPAATAERSIIFAATVDAALSKMSESARLCASSICWKRALTEAEKRRQDS